MHRGLLLLADLVALGLFSVVGASFHGVALDPSLAVRTFLPLALSWVLAAFLLGTYREASWRTFALTWLVALPAGILLRQLILGRLASPGTWAFLLVGTGMGGLFLACGRLLVHLGRLVRNP